MNIYLNKLREDKYKNNILDHILNNKLYDQAWLSKDTPDDILIKAGIDIYAKNFCYIRHDIGREGKSIDFLSNPGGVLILLLLKIISHILLNVNI